ncbi:PAS domain S-box protein [Bernardetia sp.]|uniref:SpoIIE family protein phosphatase n=1 Tax=Bernardetia sp. TaxID=1937974 RepID=UPI0025BCE203|nr:PAS domain S-box protein [Bernardetia sp.]
MGNTLQLYTSFYSNYPDAILLLENEEIISSNALAQKLLKIDDEQQLLGKKLSNFSANHSQTNTQLLSYLETCGKEGKTEFDWNFESNKKIIPTKVFLSKLEIGDKMLTQVILRGNAEEQHHHQQLKAITEALDRSAIISIADKKGKITKVNKEFCKVSKYSEEELIGKDHNIVNSGYHTKEFWQQMWQDISRGKTWRADVKNKAKDGSHYWVDTVINPMLDNNGKVMSYLSIRYLITDKKEKEFEIQNVQEKLRKQAEQFHLAVRGTADGIWDWQILTNTIYFAPRWKEMLGYKEDELANSFDTFNELLYEEDKERVSENLNQFLEGKIKDYDIEFRMKTKDGGIKWIHTRGALLRDKDGNPMRMAGAHADITKRKEEEQELRRLQKELFVEKNLSELIIANIPQAVFWKDLDFNYLGCNKLFAEGAGKDCADEIIGKSDFDMPWAKHAGLYRKDDKQIMEQNEPKLGIVEPQITADGKERWVRTNKIPLRDEKGKVFGVLGMYEDITEQKSKEALIQEQNEKLLLSEMELRQNMEILQMTQEEMLEKQELVEKQNKKLFSSEAILKKALSKMKIQESDLKDTVEELQSQEEELRQNMEELSATQEEMVKKQILVEKQKSKLEANEAVLKKALEKMKKQEYVLKESVEQLQTQEEELRQNMEELHATQEVLANQKEELELTNKQTTKSIQYAQTIQSAFLPPQSSFDNLLSESFIIYKPKDIVSGDAYWLSSHENKILIGVIDCTGHGVPGAFMSLVANNLLNEIINQRGIIQPNLILNELHKGVVQKLNQREGANNDGMDLSLCLLEPATDNTTRLTFGGVKQNLYLCRGQELLELRGNRRSIGGSKRLDDRKYEQESIILEAKDAIYLATDGYADQANEERKSFSKKRFRELIQEVGQLSMKEQGKIFIAQLEDHQKDTAQRDDITLIGFRV